VLESRRHQAGGSARAGESSASGRRISLWWRVVVGLRREDLRAAASFQRFGGDLSLAGRSSSKRAVDPPPGEDPPPRPRQLPDQREDPPSGDALPRSGEPGINKEGPSTYEMEGPPRPGRSHADDSAAGALPDLPTGPRTPPRCPVTRSPGGPWVSPGQPASVVREFLLPVRFLAQGVRILNPKFFWLSTAGAVLIHRRLR
jgi:hypothetical protein